MNVIEELTKEYSEKVTAYHKAQVLLLLSRNGIVPPTGPDIDLVGFLAQHGYRVIHEVKDTQHRIILVKIEDEQTYEIKKPKLELA